MNFLNTFDMSIVFVSVIVHSLRKPYTFKDNFDLALVINLIFILKNSFKLLKSLGIIF